MQRSSRHPSRFLIVSAAMLAMAGLALTGCGRKGDPEMPGAIPAKQTTTPKPVVEDRPFYLDPLL